MPFGAPGQKTDFTADRVSIEKADGRVVAERNEPRRSSTGHGFNTPWDPLDRAYFNGCALWTHIRKVCGLSWTARVGFRRMALAWPGLACAADRGEGWGLLMGLGFLIAAAGV